MRPTRPARFKIVCSYQNFFEQKSSSSSSRVVFLKGQDLEFRIVDTERGDADDFPTEEWVWSLVRIVSARRQERKEKSTFLGSGTYLRTNDLFLGEWRLIAKHRLRRESCSIVLVGRSVNDWSIFSAILPKARLDPDGYLERMSTCLRVNQLGNRCDEAADPTDGKELTVNGATSWDVHERLEKRLAKTKGLPRIPMQALYTSLETGRNYALRVFLAIVDGKWLLTDWSCPTVLGKTGWFEGGAFVGAEGDREGILKAIKAWEDGNRYGFGSIHWRVLAPTVAFEMKGGFTTTGTTDLDEVSEGMQYMGTAGMALEVSPNPIARKAGKVVANLSFAVSSGVNIYQKWSQGFNSVSDWIENGLDLLVLALTLAGLKRESSEIFVKAGVKNAEALAGAAQEVVVGGKKWTAMAKIEIGAGISMMAVCHVSALRTVLDIQRRKDLTSAQKVDLLVDALQLLAIQDLILIVSHTNAVFNGAKPESSGKPEEDAPETVRNLDELPGTTDGERHEAKVGRKRAETGLPENEGGIFSGEKNIELSRKSPEREVYRKTQIEEKANGNRAPEPTSSVKPEVANFFDPSKPEFAEIYKTIERHNQKFQDAIGKNPRSMNIAAHGTARDGVHYFNGKESELISVEQLAEMIRAQPGYYEGRPIRLWSCETGLHPRGVAAELSKILKTIVYAPDRSIFLHENGEYSIDKGVVVIDKESGDQIIVAGYPPNGGWKAFYQRK